MDSTQITKTFFDRLYLRNDSIISILTVGKTTTNILFTTTPLQRYNYSLTRNQFRFDLIINEKIEDNNLISYIGMGVTVEFVSGFRLLGTYSIIII